MRVNKPHFSDSTPEFKGLGGLASCVVGDRADAREKNTNSDLLRGVLLPVGATTDFFVLLLIDQVKIG